MQYHDIDWSANHKMCFHDGFGIVDRNNDDKLAALAFQNINYTAQPRYNPPTSIYYNISDAYDNCITGTLKENVTNNNLKDILLVSFGAGWAGPSSTQTYTQANGSFTICNIDPLGTSPIGVLRVSGVGTNYLEWTDPIAITSGQTKYLNYSAVHKNIIVPNTTVAISQTYSPPPESFSNITANSFIVDGDGTDGGTATFSAGGEINLKNGFHIKRGGEFHARYGLPAPDCNANEFTFRNTNINSKPENNTQLTIPNTNKYILQPLKENQQIILNSWISLYPNPTYDGKITFDLSDENYFTDITILDVLDKVIQYEKVQGTKIKINLSGNPKGVYIAKITGKENTTIKKIIFQ